MKVLMLSLFFLGLVIGIAAGDALRFRLFTSDAYNIVRDNEGVFFVEDRGDPDKWSEKKGRRNCLVKGYTTGQRALIDIDDDVTQNRIIKVSVRFDGRVHLLEYSGKATYLP